LEATRLLRADKREVHVALIGDGPDRPRLEEQIAASSPENAVRITGFLSGPALSGELEKAVQLSSPRSWKRRLVSRLSNKWSKADPSSLPLSEA
jgi:glycosyltransferase involved in cell wall biosynthesis